MNPDVPQSPPVLQLADIAPVALGGAAGAGQALAGKRRGFARQAVFRQRRLQVLVEQGGLAGR